MEAAKWDDEDNHVKRACEHYGISDEEQKKGFLLFKTKDELFRLLYGVHAMQLQISSKRFSATIHYDAEWEDWAIVIDEHDTEQKKRVSVEQLVDFPDSVLIDIYKTLNIWHWHEKLGDKPENWDELPNYRKPHMDECETKENIIRPYMRAIRARISAERIYPYF